MEKLPQSTEGEYVELVKHDVRQLGDTIVFEMEFAKPLHDRDIARLISDTTGENAVEKIIRDKLKKADWLVDGDEDITELIDDLQPSADRKTLTIWFQLPEGPLTKQ